MGINGTKPSESESNDIYSYDALLKHIDSFATTTVNRQQFVQFLFSKFDQVSHPQLGKVIVSNTFIMEQFFLYFTNKDKDALLSTITIKERIGRIYKNPQKAIELSFRLIDLNDQKKISKAEFLSFVDNCLNGLLHAVQKRLPNQQDFKIGFKTWIKANKMKFLQGNAKSSSDFWFYGDYKRWIKQKKHWSLDLDIGIQKFRTPLNLLCLFNLSDS